MLSIAHLSLILLFLQPVLGLFRARAPNPPVATAWAPSLEKDALSQALSEVFPSPLRHNPAYETAFAVFHALESKPSCHRLAAASLVFDCRSMREGGGADQDLKLLYAAQLAVCEFRVTGIDFPSECRDLSNDRKGGKAMMSACAKSLGRRPQWWTTLSNNLQNVAVMCSAVRHELEKAEILDLHRNLTKTQQSLFTVVDISLKDAWKAVTSQVEMTGKWGKILEDLIEDLMGAREDFTGVFESAEEEVSRMIENLGAKIEEIELQNQATIGGLGGSIVQARDDIILLSSEVGRALAAMLTRQTALVEGNFDLAEEHFSSLSARIEKSLKMLEMLELSTERYSLHFTGLSSSYANLAETHLTLTDSFQAQEKNQERLMTSLEKAYTSANAEVEKLARIVKNVTSSLGEMDEKVRSWEDRMTGFGHSYWLPLVTFLLGGLLLGREWGKTIFNMLLLGIFVGSFLLSRSSKLKDLIGFELFGPSKAIPSDIGIFPSQDPLGGLGYSTPPLRYLVPLCGIGILLGALASRAYISTRFRSLWTSKDLLG